MEARRATEEREREERRERGADREWSVRTALALIAFAGRLHGWPLPEDEVTARENEQVRENWAQVRAFYRQHQASESAGE